MPYNGGRGKITLDIPSAYTVRSFTTDQDKFYCFPNFKATCTINTASLDLIPLVDVSGSFSVWLVAGVLNPQTNWTTDTAEAYYFEGDSTWSSTN